MATINSLEVFENTVYKIGEILLRENVEIFNENSAGCIHLKDFNIVGDFERQMSIGLNAKNIVKARNPYTMRKIDPVNFSRTSSNVVKLGLGTYPIEWTHDQFNWVKDNPKKAGVIIGQAIAKGTLLTMLEYAIGGVASVLGANAEVTHEIAEADGLSISDFVKAVRPMGDQSSEVEMWVMNSLDNNDLILNNIENQNRLFKFGTVVINELPTGQRMLITDNRGLVQDDARYILGLTRGAVGVGNTTSMNSNITTTNGQTNILYSYQAEWESALQIKNYRYKTNQAMEGLSYAQITQASNWEAIESDPKAAPGVVIKRNLD